MLLLPRQARQCWRILSRLNFQHHANGLSTSTAATAAGGSSDAPSAQGGGASAAAAQHGQFLVLPMPKLSPEMQSGTVARWLKQEGDWIDRYDLVCEVETEELVEEAYRMGDFAGRVTLLIESQEEGVLARRIAPEGATLPAGAPIAVVWEGEADTTTTTTTTSSSSGGGGSISSSSSGGDSSSSSSSSSSSDTNSSGNPGLESAKAWVPPTGDVYDESQPSVRVLEWQSYLKESKEPPGCSKCMG